MTERKICYCLLFVKYFNILFLLANVVGRVLTRLHYKHTLRVRSLLAPSQMIHILLFQ